MSSVAMQFRPLLVWPRKQTQERVRGQFRAGYMQTLELIDKELWALGATTAVIQLRIRPDEIRSQDNMPRADCRPTHPGVVISFEGKHGPLQFACDHCLDLESNLRAIALTLERLRMADLYGVTQKGEQYKGWQSLPAPVDPHQPFPTKTAAAAWIAQRAGYNNVELRDLVDPQTKTLRRNVVSQAIIACHPDKNGGSNEAFIKLTQAREVLGL